MYDSTSCSKLSISRAIPLISLLLFTVASKYKEFLMVAAGTDERTARFVSELTITEVIQIMLSTGIENAFNNTNGASLSAGGLVGTDSESTSCMTHSDVDRLFQLHVKGGARNCSPVAGAVGLNSGSHTPETGEPGPNVDSTPQAGAVGLAIEDYSFQFGVSGQSVCVDEIAPGQSL